MTTSTQAAHPERGETMTKRNGTLTPKEKIERIAELQRRLSKALLDNDIPMARFWTSRIVDLLDTLPPRLSKTVWGDGIGTEWDSAHNFSRTYWSDRRCHAWYYE